MTDSNPQDGVTPPPAPVPFWAVDLLMAAKKVAQPPACSSPQSLATHLIALERAVAAFERRMPIRDGEIVQTPRDDDGEWNALLNPP